MEVYTKDYKFKEKSIKKAVEFMVDAAFAQLYAHGIKDDKVAWMIYKWRIDFMDEFYNKLIVERHARVTNMTGELSRLLDAVKATQVPISRGASSHVQIQEVENMDELTLYLNEFSCL